MTHVAGRSRANSPIPARLDLAQSLTGLALALFMWTHLILVSSILLGKDAMQFVTDVMEARFLSGGEHGYPIIVTITGVVVSFLFIVHAGIALRKFPSSWAQHRELRNQMKILEHADTRHWYTQATTGFVMFFLGSVHLYIMTTQPDNIGPYASADRFVTDVMWPLYLVLLFAVEIHAALGMYRLAVKWGIFDGKNPVATRKRLKLVKNALTVFFLALGLMSFAAYVKIGIEHRDRAGERYATGSPVSVETARGESR
jgi:fumarate reductase subunit C